MKQGGRGGITKLSIMILKCFNLCRNTLQAAEVLVQKLSSEYSSWNDQLGALNNELDNLVAKSYLIALNITHLSHYTYEHRM